MKNIGRWAVLIGLVYVVTWKAIGMGDEVCDTDVYTGAKTHCEKQDVEKKNSFNTKAGAEEFMAKAPKSGIKDMKVEKKEDLSSCCTGCLCYKIN